MNKILSPFFIKKEFISPLICEEIISKLSDSESSEKLIHERFKKLIPKIESHYETAIMSLTQISFEHFGTNSPGVEPHSENSSFLKKEGKWLRTSSRDFSAVLFMSDYQNNIPFDNDYEVYGGKLEFPQHEFGFNPQRGTLIIFPSDPHFINLTTAVKAGELYQARFHAVCKVPFLYNPENFPGDYTKWFKNQ